MDNEIRKRWIVESALQIARLQANGCTLEKEGELLLHCKSEVDHLIEFYRRKLEDDTMCLLMVQNI